MFTQRDLGALYTSLNYIINLSQVEDFLRHVPNGLNEILDDIPNINAIHRGHDVLEIGYSCCDSVNHCLDDLVQFDRCFGRLFEIVFLNTEREWFNFFLANDMNFKARSRK